MTSEKQSSLLRDIRARARSSFKNYPEFTEARVKNGHWEVFIIGFGWVTTTKFLNRCDEVSLHEH